MVRGVGLLGGAGAALAFVLFADVVHFQNLFSSDWPAVTIGDSGAETGNNGAAWNYGQNFGGPLKAGWASGADTVHSGGVGMFGTMGVDAPNVWSRVMPNGEIICEFPASEEPPLMDEAPPTFNA